jgi:hypothetical protein
MVRENESMKSKQCNKELTQLTYTKFLEIEQKPGFHEFFKEAYKNSEKQITTDEIEDFIMQYFAFCAARLDTEACLDTQEEISNTCLVFFETLKRLDYSAMADAWNNKREQVYSD